MNTKSSIRVYLNMCKTLGKAMAVSILLGTTLTLSAPIVADASVTDKAAISEQNGFILQTKEQKQALSEKWGVELVAMRSTAAGHMVDFRYRVTDAKKAAPLFKRQTKPYLIHQASGKVLAVPNTAKLGSLRNSNTPQEGRTYWMFFGNHHQIVKKGDKVTVAIGDFRAADIEVH
jgi:hypothetical protein